MLKMRIDLKRMFVHVINKDRELKISILNGYSLQLFKVSLNKH